VKRIAVERTGDACIAARCRVTTGISRGAAGPGLVVSRDGAGREEMGVGGGAGRCAASTSQL